MLKLISLSLAALQIQTAVSQCLNRQANFLFNRPEAIIEAPVSPPLLQPAVIENQNFGTAMTYPNPTTIITDCTPSVCQNLVNTIQLMIVSNLIRNTREGKELAAQLASSPFVNEVISSPVFSCGCSNPLANLPSNLVPSSPNLLQNYIVPTNINPRLPLAPNLMSNINANALMGNIMNMFT